MAAEGRRNVMENISVRAVQPVRIVHGRVFDDLTVRISAAAADFEVDRAAKSFSAIAASGPSWRTGPFSVR